MVLFNRLAQQYNLRRFFRLITVTTVLLVTMFGTGLTANASLQGMKTSLEAAAGDLKPAGSSDQYIPNIIGNLINAVLSLIGILLLVYLLYAGFLWMTAGGEDKKSRTSQNNDQKRHHRHTDYCHIICHC
jgi:hypothetical protein